MARPQKDGLDYFPLDVDIDQDDKVALIEAQHGVTGFAVVIKLLMKIYKNSYFYEWTEKEQLLFSKRINVDINSINVIIDDCIKWDLFDSNMLETHKILTSKGIQKRYIKASERRQRVEIEEKYLLLDDEEVNVYRNLVIVNINDNSQRVNDDINPQSKVKESKVKESKVKEKEEDKTATSDYVKFFNNNFHMITPHELEVLRSYENDGISSEAIYIALEQAVEANIRDIRYVKTVLNRWLENNIKTVEAIKADQKEFSRKRTSKSGQVKKDSFNNFQQREYDYDELEEMLLRE